MAGKLWTSEEDTILRTLLKDAASKNKMLAMLPGRSWAGIINRALKIEATRDSDAPIRRATVRLGEALEECQQRFADRVGLTLKEAQAYLMGGNYYTPEASPFGTCSIQRLTNRIHSHVDIGERAEQNPDLTLKAA